jgi:DNA-binding winged helix-turn-helix (wHTH) protein
MSARSGRLSYRFGDFLLDPDLRRLTSGLLPVPIADRYIDVLLLLVANAGVVVPKEALVQAAWPDVAVTDASLEKAISALRQALGRQPDGTHYIETVVGRGYRLAARVERVHPSAADQAPAAATLDDDAPGSGIHAALDPYGAFLEGRMLLETLDREAISRAPQAFDGALHVDPEFPAAHIGMANARLLQFEATRADLMPDRAALAHAEEHARTSCQLDPSSANAWSALAAVLHRTGETRNAVAAAKKAVALDPQDWSHQLRLAFVGWGAERLSAANRVLALRPGMALAHWLAATVFVARGAFDPALTHLRVGCAVQDAQDTSGGRFTAVGLHLVHGLVLASYASKGDAEVHRLAIDELRRELAFEESGHIYARECCANAWYAIGALQLRQGSRDAAHRAFEEALARLPGHALAGVGLEALGMPVPVAPIAAGDFNGAVAHAAAHALAGRHADAACVCRDALRSLPPFASDG